MKWKPGLEEELNSELRAGCLQPCISQLCIVPMWLGVAVHCLYLDYWPGPAETACGHSRLLPHASAMGLSG